MEVILKHWEQFDFGKWFVVEKTNPTYTIAIGGLIHKTLVGISFINLGYRFDYPYWGKGYATELAEESINYGFNELHLKEINAFVRPEHQVSRRILEKVGMQILGEINDLPSLEPSVFYSIKKEQKKTKP